MVKAKPTARNWTTEIHFVAVRVAGEIPTNIDVSHAGTPSVEAHVHVGAVLARVKGHRTAQRLAAVWRDAALHTYRLPEQSRLVWQDNPAGECPAALVVRLGPEAPLRQDLIPPTPTMPVHLRILVGPVAWLVMDRAAFRQTRELWERVERVLS